MRQVLELSIFHFKAKSLKGFQILLVWSGIFAAQSSVWARNVSVKPVPEKKATGAASSPKKSTLPDLQFLEQAEDVEREAWWIITNKRLDGPSSPFRVFRAASSQYLPQDKQSQKKINFKFCKSLIVIDQAPNTWRLESACQKPSVEIGVVQKLASLPDRWKISWKTGPFSDHFGLSTAILFTQQSCEIDLDAKGRLSRMSCPHYVRDRRESEVVEFSTFEYQAQAPKILKIVGDVKKELHVIATFQTEVPLTGDIVLKVKKVPQKAVEEKTEFSNISQPVPTRGDSNGKQGNKQAREKSEGQESYQPVEKNDSENKGETQDQGRNQIDKNQPESPDFSIKQDPRVNEGRYEENGGYNPDQKNNGRSQEGNQEHRTNGEGNPSSEDGHDEVPAIEAPPPTR